MRQGEIHQASALKQAFHPGSPFKGGLGGSAGNKSHNNSSSIGTSGQQIALALVIVAQKIFGQLLFGQQAQGLHRLLNLL